VPFTASFIGNANILTGAVQSALRLAAGWQAEIRLGDGQLIRGTSEVDLAPGAAVEVAIRPEQMLPERQPVPNAIACRFLSETYLGGHFEQRVELCGRELRIRSAEPWGSELRGFSAPPDKVRVFPSSSPAS
jgi:ABC-type Fe3+/spermidine/putrescine transport system ATPase subunit